MVGPVTEKLRIRCALTLRAFYPNEREEYALNVKVSAGIAEGAVQNVTTVSGGGAATNVTTRDTLQISSAPDRFGFAHASAWFSQADGEFDTQAGTHPYGFTFNFDLNEQSDVPAGGELRNLTFNLPPGIIGDAQAIERCTRERFNEEGCQGGAQIGTDTAGLGGQ